jgi:hypothetical protein
VRTQARDVVRAGAYWTIVSAYGGKLDIDQAHARIEYSDQDS